MDKLIAKIKAFIEIIKLLFGKSKEESIPDPDLPPVVSPTPSTPSPTPSAPVEEEPKVSDLTQAKITSFLWKPESDTNPKVAVISVSSDTLRAEDVRIRISNKEGKDLNLKTTFNYWGGPVRANKLPNHKFGRFNFKPGPTAKEFKVQAPLRVRFTVVNARGVEMPVTVMGKAEIVVKDPTKRVDLK